jgi:lysophospholipase L1-like esterase
MTYELTAEKQEELRLFTKREDAVFYDVREAPFRIYGLYEPYGGGPFCRIPEAVGEATSKAVKGLNYNTSGGRVRFTTDAAYIAICCKIRTPSGSAIMNPIVKSGFDLYIDDPKVGGRKPHAIFVNTVVPNANGDGMYADRFRMPEGEHSVTINFPLYNGIYELYIGLPEGASLKEGLPYENEKPIVFYGSSITQGAAASRPGLSYVSMVCRRLNADFRNLGFAGAAKAEEAMIEYLASLDMCCFVQDYDHNAPDVPHLRATHYKLYKRIRETHPDIPILLLSRPGFNTFSKKGNSRSDDSIARRDVVIDTFRAARAEGDERVWYIDGESFFSGPDETECTVDGVHPNDIGMLKMADSVHQTMLRILNEVPFLRMPRSETETGV